MVFCTYVHKYYRIDSWIYKFPSTNIIYCYFLLNSYKISYWWPIYSGIFKNVSYSTSHKKTLKKTQIVDTIKFGLTGHRKYLLKFCDMFLWVLFYFNIVWPNDNLELCSYGQLLSLLLLIGEIVNKENYM